MAIGVEQAPAVDQRCDEGTVVPLVEIPSGFLTADDIGMEHQPTFAHVDWSIDQAFGDADVAVQALKGAGASVVAEDNGAWRERPVDRGNQ